MPSNLCLATLTVPNVPDAISRISTNSSSYREMLMSETLSLLEGPAWFDSTVDKTVSSKISSLAVVDITPKFCISKGYCSKLPLLLKRKEKNIHIWSIPIWSEKKKKTRQKKEVYIVNFSWFDEFFTNVNVVKKDTDSSLNNIVPFIS